jgi:nicotinamide mononucleotide transporter
MDLHLIFTQLTSDLQQATWYEYLAVISGIISVWLARRENVWVYPIGLLNTVTYIIIRLKVQLPGDAAVNLYYTIMSRVGWYRWLKKDENGSPAFQISRSTQKEWMQELIFFAVIFLTLYLSLLFFRASFFTEALPLADALAGATAFTGMWLMTKKKIGYWGWYIISNAIAVPLYFYKHLSLTSLYFLVLLIMSISGLAEWNRKLKKLENAA